MDHDLSDGFQTQFRKHYPMVVRKINSIVQDMTVAEDLAQEVFLRLYRNPPQDLTRIGPWLQRTLTRISYDALRQAARRRNLADKLERASTVETAPDNETLLMEKLDRRLVADTLAKLGERDRQTLLLRHSGYSYAEIAEILDVRPETVGTLINRASTRFKQTYEQQEGCSDERSTHDGSERRRGLGAI